jgi:hypothetical protein
MRKGKEFRSIFCPGGRWAGGRVKERKKKGGAAETNEQRGGKNAALITGFEKGERKRARYR